MAVRSELFGDPHRVAQCAFTRSRITAQTGARRALERQQRLPRAGSTVASSLGRTLDEGIRRVRITLSGLMFAMLAYSSYATLKAYRGYGGSGGGRDWCPALHW